MSEERSDGFTPLHLVASRSDVNDVRLGLIRLNEETQVRMIKILLDHGANKMAAIEGTYLPVDLLKEDRKEAQRVLELGRTEKRSCGSTGSSYNGSPPPAPMLNRFVPKLFQIQRIENVIVFRLDDPPPSVSSNSTASPGPFMNNFPMDPFLNSVGVASPPVHHGGMAPKGGYAFNPGSVTSTSSVDAYGSGSDAESDIDNCTASKLAEAALDESQDLDVIAQVLYSHPTIQAVMANADNM